MENTSKYRLLFFLKKKLQFNKYYINIWEGFKDKFEYERKSMKVSHASCSIHLSLAWQGLAPVWPGSVATRPCAAAPSTLTPSRARTQRCPHPHLSPHPTSFSTPKARKLMQTRKARQAPSAVSSLTFHGISSNCYTTIKAKSPQLPLSWAFNKFPVTL